MLNKKHSRRKFVSSSGLALAGISIIPRHVMGGNGHVDVTGFDVRKDRALEKTSDKLVLPGLESGLVAWHIALTSPAAYVVGLTSIAFLPPS